MKLVDFSPVATRSTLRYLSCVLSMYAPQSIFASAWSALLTSSTMAYASLSWKSCPPVILMSAPAAVARLTSRRGLLMALCMASIARSCVSLSPTPIMAMPEFFMIVLRSAKSRLMSPGRVMSSVMPMIAFASISSASLNAVIMGRSGAKSKSLSFGITMSASVFFASLRSPSFALLMRLVPSTVNGSVTTPMVSMPRRFASCAIFASDPVPVPPPMPAVTKTALLPWTVACISSMLSCAAFSPISGLLPAPSPLVSVLPRSIFLCAFVSSKSCASVLSAMSWTFCMPLS